MPKQDLLLDLLASARARDARVDTLEAFAAVFQQSWERGGGLRNVASQFPNLLKWRLRLRDHVVGGVPYKANQLVPGSESFDTLEEARDYMCGWLWEKAALVEGGGLSGAAAVSQVALFRSGCGSSSSSAGSGFPSSLSLDETTCGSESAVSSAATMAHQKTCRELEAAKAELAAVNVEVARLRLVVDSQATQLKGLKRNLEDVDEDGEQDGELGGEQSMDVVVVPLSNGVDVPLGNGVAWVEAAAAVSGAALVDSAGDGQGPGEHQLEEEPEGGLPPVGPLGDARPRAKVRRAAAPEWSHVRLRRVWLCTKRRKIPKGRRVHPQDSSEESSSEDDVTTV